MRVAFRLTFMLAFGLLVLGLFRQAPRVLQSNSSFPSIGGGFAKLGQGSFDTTQFFPGGSSGSDSTGIPTLPNTDSLSEASSAMGEDLGTDQAPAMQSSMVRALSGVVSQNSEVFGDADSELQDNLSQADKILSESRSSARAAIRQTNRQVRIPERSAQLLLILVPGLRTDHLACYGNAGAKTPHLDQIAADGLRATQFEAIISEKRSDWDAVIHTDTRSQFAETLWKSGYSPVLLGDLSTCLGTRKPIAWDQTLGWMSKEKRGSLPFQPFPQSVSSRGRKLKLSTATEVNEISFAQTLQDEASSYVKAFKSKRPVAFVVMTPLAWWQTLAMANGASTDSDESLAKAVLSLDEFVGALQSSITREVGANRLITVVAGATVANEDASTASPAPLLVSWPTQIPAGQVINASIRARDLPATLSDMIRSTRPAKGDAGQSRWADWH